MCMLPTRSSCFHWVLLSNVDAGHLPPEAASSMKTSTHNCIQNDHLVVFLKSQVKLPNSDMHVSLNYFLDFLGPYFQVPPTVQKEKFTFKHGEIRFLVNPTNLGAGTLKKINKKYETHNKVVRN